MIQSILISKNYKELHREEQIQFYSNLLERLEPFHSTKRLSNPWRVLRLDRLQSVEALPLRLDSES